MRNSIDRLLHNESLNFILTNRIPRQFLTRFVGWFSKLEQPFIRDISIAIWRRFSDLNLEEAKKQNFTSMHDCFIRELKPGARAVDPDPRILVSPCDAIVGACGSIEGNMLLQAKEQTYALSDLLLDQELTNFYHDGCYATLRITASMYHRFHAPYDCVVEHVTYICGDVWNVNPAALKRVAKLFCHNERAVVRLSLGRPDHLLTLVPVAAVLVASIRLHFIDVLLHLKYPGPNEFDCQAPFQKGDEMGWFQHGSSIIVLAPKEFRLHEKINTGEIVRVGEPLMRTP